MGKVVKEAGSLVTLSNCKVYVYGGPAEHPPPHFHIRGPNTRCSVDLATFEPTKGHYDKKDMKEVLGWIAEPENLALIWARWRSLNEREE